MCVVFQVEDLVSNDKLNVVSEEQVFMAVMDWIKHNPTERSQFIAQVPTTILSQISHGCFRTCVYV